MFALLTDGMQTQSDFSHRVGGNLLKADLSVQWYLDPGSKLLRSLPTNTGDVLASVRVYNAWWSLDHVTPEAPYSIDPTSRPQ